MRKGGYSFDCWTPEEGLSRGYTYGRIEDARYARNVENPQQGKLARVDAQREKLAGQLGEPEATEGVPARYSKGVRVRKISLSEDAHHANKCSCSSAIRWASAYYGRKASRRQAQLSEPQRSGPCRGKRQDAARNCRCM